MWAWLPEELLQRIADQLIAGESATELRVVAGLDRRSCAIAQVHLDNMKALLQPPFSLTARDILGGMSNLNMNCSNIQSHHVQLLGAAVASGALPNLTKLFVHDDQAGDVGMAALADALGKASLTRLSLFENKIGDAGMAAFADAVGNGALSSLKVLYLHENQIGDGGITAFADAVSKGGLPNLEVLGLNGNSIGDVGLSVLAHAVSNGALPNLKELYLFQDAPALEAACKARGIGFK